MNTHARRSRTPVTITLSVWKALFLREAVHRLFGGRAAWLWLLLEPVVHVVFLAFIFSVASVRMVGGIDTAVWLMVGLLGFFMFRRTAQQTQNAVSANKALFAYRQVKPVDTVLTRAGLEGFLMLAVTGIVVTGAELLGAPMVPADPLAVLEAFIGLWLVGLGFGLIVSVASELIPEIGKFVGLLMTPLYFVSGIMVPIANLAPHHRELLMLNPVAHGLEAGRLAFAPYYQAAPELSISYLYGFALVTIFFGLALQVRFQAKLVTE